MNKFIPIVFVMILFFIIIPNVDASNGNVKCSISQSAYIFPIFYQDELRANPDNTFYPGDGFHYLFKFSGSDTCFGFYVQAIKSEAEFDLLSHNVISGPNNLTPLNNLKIHPHNDSEIIPKYLTTTHYYIDRIKYHGCEHSKGRCSTLTETENPSFSVREDQTKSNRLNKIIDSARTASMFSLRTETTQAWGFTTIGVNHDHIADEHIYENQETIASFEELIEKMCLELRKNQGCIFGHTEIDTEVVKVKCLLAELEKMKIKHDLTEDDDLCVDIIGKISLTVNGKKMACYHVGINEECRITIVQKIAKIKPIILEPIIEINLSKPPLPDTSGYDAKNLDETYYVNDPLSIINIPDFQWKNERAETIQFSTEKISDLKKGYDNDCTKNSCDLFLEYPGVKPHAINLGNGDGITIYNVPTNEFLGNHEFDYFTKVYNMNKTISSAYANTDALVVKYDPQYTNYPYPRIADDQRYAFDDRQAAALHYFGSEGGGPDDIDGVHQDRRSIINDFHHVGFMFDPWIPTQTNQAFTWSGAENSALHEDIPDDIKIISSNLENLDVIPFESNGNNAMFVKSGYGKVFFNYPLSPIIFDNKTGSPKYENVTSFVTLKSSNFAGKDTTWLTFWEFMAPEASFVTNFVVKTINQNGTITNKPIHVTAVPQIENGAISLIDYLNEKIFFDSQDKGLAETIVNDTYPMIFDYTSNGIIDEKLRRTASQFQEFENVSYYTNSKINGIIKQSEDYLKESKKLRLKIPLEVGLTVPSPTNIIVNVNGITKTINAQFIDFGTDREMLINVENDNTLKTVRGLGFLQIYYDKNFGGIVKISVNDKVIDAACLTGCTIPIHQTDSLAVIVWNEWGGSSHTTLQEYTITEIPKAGIGQISPIIGLLILLLLGYILYRKLRKRE